MNLGKDYDRLHIVSQARYAMGDDFVPPAKRTIQQKFQIQAQRAANRLEELKMMTGQSANLFLEEFIIPVSNQAGTMNGAAFALVFCCYDFLERKFVMDKSKNVISWKKLLENISQPKAGFDEFIKEYGITVNDLIRYFIYTENYFKNKS